MRFFRSPSFLATMLIALNGCVAYSRSEPVATLLPQYQEQPPSVPVEPSTEKIAIPSPGPWHTVDLNTKLFAEDFARYFHVIGLPKQYICQFMGQMQFSKDNSEYYASYGPYSKTYIECQFWNGSITRMRLVERIGDTEQIGRTGKWQTREYRDKSAQFRSAMSMVELGSKIDPIENPATSWDRFDSYDWLVSPEKRGWTVYDLVHAHRLVGISREKLHTLLGPGVNSKMQNVSSDPLALDTETYPLFWHYRGTDNDFFLEFSFAHEHVRAFRSIILASRN